MKTYFIIEDWAGNEIKEKSKSGLWITMEFGSFWSAWDKIAQIEPDEDNQGDYYAMKKVRP